jgi:hypothetical protein
MKLTQLDPQFLRAGHRPARGKFLKPGIDPLRGNWTDEDWEERDYEQTFFDYVDSLSEADGISFLNPAEFVANNGKVGTSTVHVYFEGKALFGDMNRNGDGQYVRWAVSGTGYEDLTISPSIFVNPHGNPPGWHGFVKGGEVTNA